MTTALVTGASSGIGKATATRLMQEGFTVYVAARRVEAMDELRNLGAIPFEMDISRDEDIVEVVQQIGDRDGGVDVLINNAGFGTYGSVEETSLEDARYQFEVNLFGMARLTQLLLPAMRARGRGRIVNMSSMGGRIYTPLGAWYHASKHAVEGWSDCLRLELAPFGIAVVIVEPGTIATEFGDVLLGPMLERSGSGPYAGLAHSMARATRNSYDRPGGSSPPSLVAKTILKAVKARRPRTRYVVGKYARPLILLRKWGGDRLYDRLLMSQLG